MRKSKNSILRWALALSAFLVLAVGPSSALAEGPGGASSFTAPKQSATGTASTGLYTFSPWRSAGASWYGPGLYGNGVACGGTLRPATVGVAHKTLRCGTPVKFKHRGNVVVARVIDRGPYISGRSWDLTEAAAVALEFEDVGVGTVRYSIATRYARSR